LDEVGKLMERIVVGRLNEHLSRGGGLSARQFGFRAGRSTIDAVGFEGRGIVSRRGGDAKEEEDSSRGPFWVPFCGTSRTTKFWGEFFPLAATSSVMQMTLAVAGGRCWENAIARGNVAVAGIVGGIKGLGLGVAPRKTEAIFFHDGSRGAPPRLSVRVDGHRIEVGAQMRYLGLRC